MWDLTTDHHVPPSQPRAPPFLLRIMQCPPHWTLLPLLPYRICLPHGSRGILPGHHITALPSALQIPPFHPNESKAFSHCCSICLPPTFPASSPDTPSAPGSGPHYSLHLQACAYLRALALALPSASNVLPPNILTAAPFTKDPTPK